jgi:hypothetical protein
MSAPSRLKRESFEQSEKASPITAPSRLKRESFEQSEKASPTSRPPLAGTSPLRLHRRHDPARAEVERFIADVYRRHFGARLAHYMPVLVSRHRDGGPCAAAGYRSAAEALFLEQYLPQPIEQMLAAAGGREVERERIVEVGQFASTCAGEGRNLILALTRHLVDCGFRWAVITATAELRRLFARHGLVSLALAPAEPKRLGAAARLWGSYYEHAPKVLAGDLLDNLARMQRRKR